MNNRKWKFAILGITILMALGALWLTNHVAKQIRLSEEEKVRTWAKAISQKAELVNYTESFFEQVAQDEHRKIALYADILKSFANLDLNSDMQFSLDYVNYITDSSKTSLIITDRDSIITSCRNIIDDSVDATFIGKKLDGTLLEVFSKNKPIHYKVWGMPTTLYYRESVIYSELRNMLQEMNRSFFDDITNNSVFVPVVIVDSLQGDVLGYGNVKERDIDTDEKLSLKLCDMEKDNDPIEIRLPDHQRAYVFYEKTPLLKLLSWVPIIYMFIAMILILVSYNLFRTARTMEQNRIWVGMAKETAHQLGTPISSLIAWTEYLEDKTLEEKYAVEIRKDLNRLETITHRFSKIGSVPELTEEDICPIIQNAMTYLQSRSSKKVKFVLNLPNEPVIVPLNSYLFEWVIENLCKNAIDAMNGAGTFSIILSTDSRKVYLDVSDTGKGIPSANQKHIFESGFTTKQRGWGLGLSLAKRIINEYHKGKIYLKYSIPGQGSVFRIELSKSNK